MTSGSAAVATRGGRYADAIADCNHAVVLHPRYDKALKRRADLYTELHDYEHAVRDVKAMRQPPKEMLRELLVKMQKSPDAKRDHYKLLGVESGDHGGGGRPRPRLPLGRISLILSSAECVQRLAHSLEGPIRQRAGRHRLRGKWLRRDHALPLALWGTADVPSVT